MGIGVSSLANKLHLASKSLQNKHLITVGTGFENTRAPKTHHTMRNSRRLARYKAHGFFLATRQHWDALTKHAGSRNYKKWNGTDLGKQNCSLVEDWPQQLGHRYDSSSGEVGCLPIGLSFIKLAASKQTVFAERRLKKPLICCDVRNSSGWNRCPPLSLLLGSWFLRLPVERFSVHYTPLFEIGQFRIQSVSL